MKTEEILERVYPEVAASRNALAKRRRQSLVARRRWSQRARVTALILPLVGFWATMHLYYYNKLIGLEYNVNAAWAQVETQLQRRHNIQLNLTRMVLDYAAHEREVLTGITKLRTTAVTGTRGTEEAAKAGAPAGPTTSPSAEPAAPAETPSPAADGARSEGSNAPAGPSLEQLSAAKLEELFSRILVVAEQYPQLKLSENFRQFSAAIIDTETEIAGRTSVYNDSVNIYGTELAQFPGNFFAWTFGFKKYEFYQPDQQALTFQGVAY